MRHGLKIILVSFIILLLIRTLSANAGESVDKNLWQKALKIHDEAIVIDTHCDTPTIIVESGLDIGHKSSESNLDLIRMKKGGLDASFFVVFYPFDWKQK